MPKIKGFRKDVARTAPSRPAPEPATPIIAPERYPAPSYAAMVWYTPEGIRIALPAAPSAGDTFTCYPGCDRALLTCTNKFGNQVNFRGYPYIPSPESAK